MRQTVCDLLVMTFLPYGKRSTKGNVEAKSIVWCR